MGFERESKSYISVSILFWEWKVRLGGTLDTGPFFERRKHALLDTLVEQRIELQAKEDVKLLQGVHAFIQETIVFHQKEEAFRIKNIEAENARSTAVVHQKNEVMDQREATMEKLEKTNAHQSPGPERDPGRSRNTFGCSEENVRRILPAILRYWSWQKKWSNWSDRKIGTAVENSIHYYYKPQ